MTIQGARIELINMLNDKNLPIYYEPILKKVIETIEQEPKTGHWIDDEFGSKCSCCGIHTHLDKFDRPMKFKYCSMCGAKMIELQESEDKE